MRPPRTRDSKPEWPHPVTYRYRPTILHLARDLTYLSYFPTENISGDLWGEAFARAVGGRHLASPVGHVDVVKKHYAWSVKTIKSTNPHSTKRVRIISGRNSPDYSSDIYNPREDVAKTGEAVIEIWNARIDIGLSKYPIGYRSSVLIRNMKKMTFTYFEAESKKYDPADYEWSVNSRGNMVAKQKSDGKHAFTWQPHGGQFTILHDVPDYAVKFSIDKKAELDLMDVIRKKVNFRRDWVTIYD